MNKEILKYLPLTTLLISMLFICGGLYLVGYWSTFEIDPFSLISVWDIPKSFIMPFVISNVIMLLSLILFGIYNISITGPDKPIAQPTIKRKSTVPFKIAMSFLVLMIILIILYPSCAFYEDFWTYSLMIVAVYMIYYINKVSFIKKHIPHVYLRLFLIMSAVYIPFTCFTLGKTSSIRVYRNMDIKYFNIRSKIAARTTIDSISSLKLLGFLGDKFIVSTFDNERKFVLKQADYEALEISNKEILPK